MTRPTQGKVIEPSIAADISEVSIEEGCKALEEAGTVPRVLSYAIEEHVFKPAPDMQDLARKYGLTAIINSDYADSEWAIHDLGDGNKRITYWNKPL